MKDFLLTMTAGEEFFAAERGERYYVQVDGLITDEAIAERLGLLPVNPCCFGLIEALIACLPCVNLSHRAAEPRRTCGVSIDPDGAASLPAAGRRDQHRG